MSADVTIENIATTLAEERRELRAVLAPLADLPAVLRELARAVVPAQQPAPDDQTAVLRESAVLLELGDDLGLDRHRRLSDGSKVEDLPAVELRREIVEMLRTRAAETVAHTCDAEHALVRVRSALRGGLEQLGRPWAPDDDIESLVTQLLLACSLARPVDAAAYKPLAGSLGLSVKLDDLDGPDARVALLQAIRDRALADRQADIVMGQDGVIDAVSAALGVPGRIDGETAADWAVRVAVQVGEGSRDDDAHRAGALDALRAFGAEAAGGCENWPLDSLLGACQNLGEAYRTMQSRCAVEITKDVFDEVVMQRDDALTQLRATDAVLRRAVQAADVEPEGLTTCELAQRLAEIAAIRDQRFQEIDAAPDADMDVITTARDTIERLDRTLRTALQAAGESTDDATVLDLAERLAARATDLPRSARDGARREQREIVAALALDVRLDHLSVPGARAEIVRAVQSTTDAAGDRAAELLRDVARVLRAVTPDLPEHASVTELAHDVAERARRATDGTPDYKRPIDVARRTDDGAIWAVWSACETLGVTLVENATIADASTELATRLEALAVWIRDSLPLVRLWDRQLVDLCPLDVPNLDKARDDAATLGATDDDEGLWKELAADVRAVADGDDIDGLVSWLDVTKDARAVLGALLDRVDHLEDKLQDKDDVDPRTETPLAEKLAQRMFEHWPAAVPVATIQALLHSIGEDAAPDDPAVRVLLDALDEAQRPRDLVAWCALAPTDRNRLIDRTQEALDAVA